MAFVLKFTKYKAESLDTYTESLRMSNVSPDPIKALGCSIYTS